MKAYSKKDNVIKEISGRHYYDYTKQWVQPVCTSNSSYGTFTGGGYFNESQYGNRAYYHVSDNSWPTSTIGSGGWDGTCWGTTHSETGWFNWNFPEKIRITNIRVMARNYNTRSDWYIKNGRFYTNSSKSTPIGDAFSFSSVGQKLNIKNIPAGGILTNNLYFSKPGGGQYSGFAEIWITGYVETEVTKEEYENGTPYAYYKDFYSKHTEVFREFDGLKYYKIVDGIVVETDESDYEFTKPYCRDYYKYDTSILIPNADVIGRPTNLGNIISNFSSKNYLKLPVPFTPENNTWEIIFKISTSSYVSRHISIFGNYGNTYQNAPEVSIDKDSKKFYIIIPKDGSSTKIVESTQGSYVSQPNTEYWLKLEFTGTQYNFSYSLDGVTFVQDISVDSSEIIYQATEGFTIGGNFWDVSSDSSFNGSIDLNESYIKVGGEYWWKGTRHPIVKANSTDYDFYKDVIGYRYKALKSWEKGQYYTKFL